MIRLLFSFMMVFFPSTIIAAPNIVFVITDDQGYGDLGAHGNPVLQTPHLDRFCRESTQLKRFYACPVCSPTRSSLMTGRYYYRTGVVDTYIGRSMMFPDEITLAEILKTSGYRTGLVGKWHLGDCYPMRAQDQGFEEVLSLRGGGIGQPSDPPGGNSYFDPILFRNGTAQKFQGYVTDILTDAAIAYIQQKSDKPYFLYLAYNAPHDPLEVPEAEVKPYLGQGLQPQLFPKMGYPLEGKWNPQQTSKVYGMVANIDRNLGRLLQTIDALGQRDNTIVVFMTDNGPQHPRYNSGLRGRKGTVYEGGIRVPFYVRWPQKIQANRQIDYPSATIDVVPTLAAIAGAKFPQDRPMDGMDLSPLLLNQQDSLAERTLIAQWHRGNTPEAMRACAVIESRYKLVQPAGVTEKWDQKQQLQLFDLQADPYEMKNILADVPEVAQSMEKKYHAWYASMKETRQWARPRIHIGSNQEPITTLTRQDWRGEQSGWTPQSIGHWELLVEKPMNYSIQINFPVSKQERKLYVQIQNQQSMIDIPLESNHVNWTVKLEKGNADLHARIEQGKQTAGITWATLQPILEK